MADADTPLGIDANLAFVGWSYEEEGPLSSTSYRPLTAMSEKTMYLIKKWGSVAC